jgi:hypothetical protein
MRAILLTILLFLAVPAFTQQENPIQIVVKNADDSTRLEINDTTYYTNHEGAIFLEICPGVHDLYVFLPEGLIVYNLDISEKTSIIIIEL